MGCSRTHSNLILEHSFLLCRDLQHELDAHHHTLSPHRAMHDSSQLALAGGKLPADRSALSDA